MFPFGSYLKSAMPALRDMSDMKPVVKSRDWTRHAPPTPHPQALIKGCGASLWGCATKPFAQSRDQERARGLRVPPASACCGDGGKNGGSRASAAGEPRLVGNMIACCGFCWLSLVGLVCLKSMESVCGGSCAGETHRYQT